MEDLIPIINELQEVFSTSGSGSDVIQLPQIVVIGEQSVGKSSVLESLVGRTCLPRGKGIVTRCPIVLQLLQKNGKAHTRKTGRQRGEHLDGSGEWPLLPGGNPPSTVKVREHDSANSSSEEYCEFPHLPEGTRIVKDFDEIVNVINTEVDKRAGTNKNIIPEEMIMRICSPNVVNLTVVDLPGLVKNPVGDQPLDIEMQVEKLLRGYIENPNAIILAVSAATNDIATSWSLKLAKEVDPELNRTVVVLTKLDRVEVAANAIEVLTGRTLSVKLGIIGVVNRSGEDIDNNKTIEDSIGKEGQFLKDNYPMLASSNGIPYLRHKLQSLLLSHIQGCLPDLQTRLSLLKAKAEEEMKILGSDVPMEKSPFLFSIISKFCEAFTSGVRGTGRQFRNHAKDNKSLMGVAKLRNIFRDKLTQQLHFVEPLKDLDNLTIWFAIQNSLELESGFVVTEVAFQDLVRDEIYKLEQPTIDCADLVLKELLQILDASMKSLKGEMVRFPKVRNEIASVVRDLLQQSFDVAQDELKKFVHLQAAYVIMDQTEFSAEIKELQQLELQELELQQLENSQEPPAVVRIPATPLKRPQLSATDVAKCKIMRKMVAKYFKCVKNFLIKYFPQVISKYMISFICEKALPTLNTQLCVSGKFEELVVEDVFITAKREHVKQQLLKLRQATKIVAKIRDTDIN